MERPGPEENPCCREVQLRKQLLLLATLVVCVTYVAGINPPGGVWQWDEEGSNHHVGISVLRDTKPVSYIVFFYSNSMAHAASVSAVFLLLLKKPRRGLQLIVLRVVIVLGLLSLIGAYVAAGSDRGIAYTLYTSVLAIILLLYILLYIRRRYLLPLSTSRALQEERRQEEEEEEENDLDGHARRKLLMLFATFVAAITYVAGLRFSGGYWDRVESSNQQGYSGPKQEAKVRFDMLIYFNSTAFTASLFLLFLLLSKNTGAAWSLVLLYVSILVGLLGPLGAYATGTRWDPSTDSNYLNVLWLIGAFLGFISFVIGMINIASRCHHCSSEDDGAAAIDGGDEQEESVGYSITRDESCRKVKSLVVMLATLVAASTYQAGLHPPGGVWPDDRDGHSAGEPIILSTHPWRYKVFLYCNSGAFLSSLAAIFAFMVHKEKIHTMLLVSLILDMVALMGAYAAGTWWDGRSSIYVIFIAVCIVVVVVPVMIHLLCVTIRTTDMDYAGLVKKRHTRLLLVTNFVATITYQAGLNLPGGFRRQKENGHGAGAALLMDKDPRLFSAVFYCNTVSFMATMALILFFLVSPSQYRLGTRWYAIYTSIVLALFGLMAAYAVVGIMTGGQTPVLSVIAIAVSVIAAHTMQSRSFLLKEEEEEEKDGSSAVGWPATIPRPRPRPRHIPRPRVTHRTAQETKHRQVYTSRKHLILLGIVAASATYQAGLHPPGGLWQENGDHGGAGSPVLYDRYMQRYYAFLYSNSTSFVASLFVVTLQLQQILLCGHQPKHRKLLVQATNTALVLDLLGLMATYAAGAAKGWEDAIAMFVLVLFCVAIHAAPWIQRTLYSCMHHCKANVRNHV